MLSELRRASSDGFLSCEANIATSGWVGSRAVARRVEPAKAEGMPSPSTRVGATLCHWLVDHYAFRTWRMRPSACGDLSHDWDGRCPMRRTRLGRRLLRFVTGHSFHELHANESLSLVRRRLGQRATLIGAEPIHR